MEKQEIQLIIDAINAKAPEISRNVAFRTDGNTIIWAVGLLVALFGIYMVFTLNDTNIESRVTTLEKNQLEIQSDVDEIKDSVDSVDDGVKELQNSLTNFEVTFQQQVVDRFPLYLDSLNRVSEEVDGLSDNVGTFSNRIEIIEREINLQ